MIAAHPREVAMAQGIYYDVDGRIGGPVSFLQLQLMASSGMLQPHHRVRKEESDQWFPARQVKGLYSPSEVAATATPVPAPAMPPAPESTAEEEENPFAWAPSEPAEEPEVNSAFNFFAPSSAAPPAPPPKKAPRPVVEEPMPVEPVEEEPEPLPPPPAPKAPEPKPTPKAEEPKPKPEPPPPKTEPKTDEVTHIPATIEVSGEPVELLPDDSAQLLEGKTVFRLSKTWLVAVTKFADGMSRHVYLRLQRIDAAIVEQRPGPRRGKGGSVSILAFRAGNVEIALAFQGSDKPYRSFAEKVILIGNAGRK
jgi:hypothetical protein